MSNEPRLLEAARRGDADAFAQLVGRTGRSSARTATGCSDRCPTQRTHTKTRSCALGFSARETAQVLEMTPVSVDSALQRAHKTIDERVPAQSQQTTPRALGDERVRDLVNRFAEAWETHDVDTLVTMLADDARMTMPPQPSWYQGRHAIETFLGLTPLSPERRFRFHPISANAQPALAAYIETEQTGAFEAESIIVLTLRGNSIEEITAFRSPELFPLFGLPEQPPT